MKPDRFAWANDNEDVRSLYAVTLFGRIVTPWRRKRDDAIKDAIAKGHASYDREGGVLYWWAGTDLIERRV